MYLLVIQARRQSLLLLLAIVMVTLSPSARSQQGPCVGCVQVYQGPTLGMQWVPFGTAGVSVPPPSGGILFNDNGLIGTLIPGTSFTVGGGVFALAPNAACFNLGPWSGDLSGAACSAPTLSAGAAARNVGAITGGVTGTLPNLSLNPASVIAALGPPTGDLGGPDFIAPLVVGIQGIPVSPTIPLPQSALVLNNGVYTPTVLSPGINQTNQDVLCGPGSGLQPCTIAPGVVNNTKLADEPPATVKCNPNAAGGTPTDCPVTGGLVFLNGALQLGATGVVAQQITVGTNCWVIGVDGRISAVNSGACNSGATITADDGVTTVTADDGATAITADGGGGVTGCTALAYKYNVACDIVAQLWRPF